MQATYRNKNINEYWHDRWDQIPIDSVMKNENIYPLKYANMTIQSQQGRILELGCGPGRLLRYYKNRGYNIVGVDFVEAIIDRLKKTDPELQVEAGNAQRLHFNDKSFRYVLAFGIYHNLLEDSLKHAIQETFRILEPGGKVCASFRADNFQKKIMDRLSKKQTTHQHENNTIKIFHKLNLTRPECITLFKEAGFEVENIFPVENMSFLYKFSCFRSKSQKLFDEHIAREEGYTLSFLGQTIQKFLMKLFPNTFCNVYVLIAKKKEIS